MIAVGSCGTKERRWLFDQCPGLHLAGKVTIDGKTSAFIRAWRAHFAYTHGHSIGDPVPPKLYESVILFEAELKARDALVMQRHSEEREKKQTKNQGPHVKAAGYGQK